MLYIVEVGSAGNVGAVMSQMRTWLDHYGAQPGNFRHVREITGSKFRVEAVAFASAFGGRVLRPEPQLPPLIRMAPAPARLHRHELHGRYSRSASKRASG
jgi:hypothetical protein